MYIILQNGLTALGIGLGLVFTQNLTLMHLHWHHRHQLRCNGRRRREHCHQRHRRHSPHRRTAWWMLQGFRNSQQPRGAAAEAKAPAQTRLPARVFWAALTTAHRTATAAPQTVPCAPAAGCRNIPSPGTSRPPPPLATHRWPLWRSKSAASNDEVTAAICARRTLLLWVDKCFIGTRSTVNPSTAQSAGCSSPPQRGSKDSRRQCVHPCPIAPTDHTRI